MTPLISRLIDRVAPAGVPLRFAARDVPPEEQTALFAAARVAPSADNLQTWRFVAVRDAATRGAIAEAVPSSLAGSLKQAPLVVAVCGVRTIIPRIRREQPFVLVDVPIALTHVLLQAAELGLACAWTLELDEARVRGALGVPEETAVIALCAVGWPE
jgi:nitroreductase